MTGVGKCQVTLQNFIVDLRFLKNLYWDYAIPIAVNWNNRGAKDVPAPRSYLKIQFNLIILHHPAAGATAPRAIPCEAKGKKSFRRAQVEHYCD